MRETRTSKGGHTYAVSVPPMLTDDKAEAFRRRVDDIRNGVVRHDNERVTAWRRMIERNYPT